MYDRLDAYGERRDCERPKASHQSAWIIAMRQDGIQTFQADV